MSSLLMEGAWGKVILNGSFQMAFRKIVLVVSHNTSGLLFYLWAEFFWWVNSKLSSHFFEVVFLKILLYSNIVVLLMVCYCWYSELWYLCNIFILSLYENRLSAKHDFVTVLNVRDGKNKLKKKYLHETHNVPERDSQVT